MQSNQLLFLTETAVPQVNLIREAFKKGCKISQCLCSNLKTLFSLKVILFLTRIRYFTFSSFIITVTFIFPLNILCQYQLKCFQDTKTHEELEKHTAFRTFTGSVLTCHLCYLQIFANERFQIVCEGLKSCKDFSVWQSLFQG